MHALIIDDVYRARRGLSDQIEQLFPNTFTIQQAGSVEEGLQKIKELSPAVVFLDIQMEDGSGFDLLNNLSYRNFELIFTTAHEQYALQAFDHSATSYLLKPISPEKLTVALQKAIENRNRSESAMLFNKLNEGSSHAVHRFKIPIAKGLRFIDGDDIIYLKAEGNYFKIFFTTDEKPLLVSKSLRYFENQMDNNVFMRIHKSYIVNLKKVLAYSRSDGGTLIMPRNYEVPVSPLHRDSFLRRVSASI